MDKIRELVIRDLSTKVKVVDIAAKFDINRRTVYKIKALYDETGGFKKRENGGRKRSVLTESNLAKIKDEATSNPTIPMKELAKHLSMSTMSISRGIKELGGKSLAISKRPLLTDAMKEKHLERAKVLLNKLKKGKEGVIIFSDEKNFCLDKFSNRRNSRYLDFGNTPDSVKYCPKTKKPQSVMVLGVVGSDGKVCPPIFIPEGLRVNTEVYLRLLIDHVIPWIKANYQEGEYTFQQDSAPAHGSKKTQQFLSEEVRFWSKKIWPPNSPDINLLDYYWWGRVEPISNATSHKNLESLKASISAAWASIRPEEIRKAASRFRPRLEAIIAAGGGHIE